MTHRHIKSHDLTIPAADGYALAATLFEPDASDPTAPLIVIGAATGVPRRYYARFALYLAGHGHPVLTFDYRGVSQSRPEKLIGFPARMRDWGILDIPGVLDHAHRTMPGRPIHWIGNSYGGFGTGLAHNNHLIARQLSISSVSAYLGWLDGLERYRLTFLMSVPMRFTTYTLGYFPGHLIGGEDLPKGVALEWADWCLTPGFLFSDDTLHEKRHFATFTAPHRIAIAEDDTWVSREGAEHLAGQYPNAETSIWRITLAEAGQPKIGHLGFFRPEFRDTLWRAALAWLANESATS